MGKIEFSTYICIINLLFAYLENVRFFIEIDQSFNIVYHKILKVLANIQIIRPSTYIWEEASIFNIYIQNKYSVIFSACWQFAGTVLRPIILNNKTIFLHPHLINCFINVRDVYKLIFINFLW